MLVDVSCYIKSFNDFGICLILCAGMQRGGLIFDAMCMGSEDLGSFLVLYGRVLRILLHRILLRRGYSCIAPRCA